MTQGHHVGDRHVVDRKAHDLSWTAFRSAIIAH